MITTCYCVDITRNVLKIERMDYADYKHILHEKKLHCILDLGDHDNFTFKSVSEAEKFIDDYLAIYNDLCTDTYKSVPKMPKLLLKRKYIPTTLMGLKNKTTRKNILKNCRSGDLFQMYDQTYFITARMTEIRRVKIDNEYFFEHHFKIIQQKEKC